MAAVAFVDGPEIAVVRGNNTSYRIVKVLVVGLHTPEGIVATAPAAHFTIFKVNEQSV